MLSSLKEPKIRLGSAAVDAVELERAILKVEIGIDFFEKFIDKLGKSNKKENRAKVEAIEGYSRYGSIL